MTQKRDEATKQILTTELEALDTQLEQRTASLASIKTSIKSVTMKRNLATKKLVAIEEKVARQEQDFAKRERELQSQLEDLARQLSAAQGAMNSEQLDRQTRLDEINGSIKSAAREAKERDTYLKHQEGIIQSTLDDGSARIADLDYQVKKLLNQQQMVLQQNAENEQARDVLVGEIANLLERKERLQDTYAALAAQYRESLADMKRQLSEATEQRQQQMAEAKRTVELLSRKERELVSREDSLASREKEAADEKRFIESRKHLYGNQKS